jgi:hypothetical protein
VRTTLRIVTGTSLWLCLIAACASSEDTGNDVGASQGAAVEGGATSSSVADDASKLSGQEAGPEGAVADGTPSDATLPDVGTSDVALYDTALPAVPDAAGPDGAVLCQATAQPCGASTRRCAPGDKCSGLYNGSGVRAWPMATDATGPTADSGVQGCTDSQGNVWPSEGVGAATWFEFIDCGSYKIFPVSTGCKFDILTYNDCCSGCYLQNVNLDVQEMVDGGWTTLMTINHPYTGSCASWNDSYVPTTAQVRLLINGGIGSYACVYEE